MYLHYCYQSYCLLEVVDQTGQMLLKGPLDSSEGVVNHVWLDKTVMLLTGPLNLK